MEDSYKSYNLYPSANKTQNSSESNNLQQYAINRIIEIQGFFY